MEANAGPAFLSHFSTERRSTVSNRFLHAVRAGIDNPHNVIVYVAEHGGDCPDILEMMADYPDEAYQYAENRIAYERLPHEEKAKIKADVQERSRKEWMKHNPPSEKQIAYLASLGYTLPVATMEEASHLIDERLRK